MKYRCVVCQRESDRAVCSDAMCGARAELIPLHPSKWDLKPGHQIGLNTQGQEWTRGLTFTIDEVKPWGVICHADQLETEELRAPYRATWDQIAGMVAVFVYCFRHLDRVATQTLSVGCAPGGILPVCSECADPANGRAVFQHYQAMHSNAIVNEQIKARGQNN